MELSGGISSCPTSHQCSERVRGQGGPGEWSGQRYASVVDLFYEDAMKNGELVEATN